MAIPAWLDPWWRDERLIAIPLRADHILARVKADRPIRTTLLTDGNELIVTKRSRYLGGYVRTVAKLANRDSETEVKVVFGRSSATAWIMVGFGVLAVLVPLAEALPLVITNGLSHVNVVQPSPVLLSCFGGHCSGLEPLGNED